MAAAPAIITESVISTVIYPDPVITLTYDPSAQWTRQFTCFLDGIKLNHTRYASRSVWMLPWYGLVIKADVGWQTWRERQFYEEKLRPEDTQFFPKRITCGRLDAAAKVDFIIQEYVSVDFVEPDTKPPLLVSWLCQKYEIEDVCNNNSNWGFRKFSQNPCIFDLGLA